MRSLVLVLALLASCALIVEGGSWTYKPGDATSLEPFKKWLRAQPLQSLPESENHFFQFAGSDYKLEFGFIDYEANATTGIIKMMTVTASTVSLKWHNNVKSCYIDLLKATKEVSGTNMMQILHAFCLGLGATYSELIDEASVICRPTEGQITNQNILQTQNQVLGSWKTRGSMRYWLLFTQNIPSLYTKDSFGVHVGGKIYNYKPKGNLNGQPFTDMASFEKVVVPFKNSLSSVELAKSLIAQGNPMGWGTATRELLKKAVEKVQGASPKPDMANFIPTLLKLHNAKQLNADDFCAVYYAFEHRFWLDENIEFDAQWKALVTAIQGIDYKTDSWTCPAGGCKKRRRR